MPPRWVTAIIVVFWLGATFWLVYRETTSGTRAGEAPPFVIDLTDEVSANTIAWTVVQNGERVGTGLSSVGRRPDRIFEFKSEFRFHDLNILKIVKFHKLASMYRVTADGHFRSLTAEVFLENSADPTLVISGRLEHGFVVPKVAARVGQHLIAVPFQQKIKVDEHGSILNPMHLVNKINGLREGQTWTIPLMDPLAGNFTGPTIRELEAKVLRDRLYWDKQDVACFRIDYREPGKQIAKARTWVRCRDGLVLQQEAQHLEREIVLIREKTLPRRP